ncbi:calcium/calmodulin-dependent protein kinase type IV-like isoform X2 [Tubulanus polymorphus]|uniref:calcium/calmodulin-dependent protein kinase type IV-like isoform X2 n=1 Tax=Tubulanus polymorphus TaxID=672921 RepID=UPI003DA27A76
MLDAVQGSAYWFSVSNKEPIDKYYEIGKELGRGATSVVYKCIEKGTNKAWAVKCIEKKGKIDRKIIRSEIGILLKLKHPNMIRLKDIFESDLQISLVLELVTGGELFDRIVSRGFYSEKDAAAAIKDILEAIVPENLLYENSLDDSKLKLADFGLSKMIGPDALQMNTVCGTPGYCAPEVLGHKVYDRPVDMWGVGVITYILLCGYEPFYEESDAVMFRRIMKGEYRFDSPWWDEVSMNAKDLIRKLLVMDPKKRFTAQQALRHPWVTGHAAKNQHMEVTQTKLKEFNARRKLKALTNVVIAANIYARPVGSASRQSGSPDTAVAAAADSSQRPHEPTTE